MGGTGSTGGIPGVYDPGGNQGAGTYGFSSQQAPIGYGAPFLGGPPQVTLMPVPQVGGGASIAAQPNLVPLSVPGGTVMAQQLGPGAYTIPYSGPVAGQVTGTTTYIGGGQYVQGPNLP